MQTNIERPPDAVDVFAIWPGSGIPPGSELWNWHEQAMQPPHSTVPNEMVRNVVVPTVTMFKPAADTANGTAIIIAPVPEDAPPLFIAISDDDDAVAPISSARLYEDWHKSGKSVELHIFANGGHGFGMHEQNLLSDIWSDLFKNWLASLGYMLYHKLKMGVLHEYMDE